MSDVVLPHEVSTSFRSLEEFRAFLERNSNTVLAAEARDNIADLIRQHGCREPLTERQIRPFELSSSGGLREGLTFDGIGSRVRGVMLCIEEIIAQQQLSSPRIYAAEGLTAFALRMRGLYPRFLGSEFTSDPTRKEWMYPIPCEDLQNLSMPDGSFDIVSTNEVLEHVPSIDAALAEIARVLSPGGWHIGTVPFLFFAVHGQRRAMLTDQGDLIHLLEPEYHGDPMNDGGALVFELPGWDIIERARKAGFRDAFIRFVMSKQHGVIAENIGGVLAFCCQK